MSGFQARRRLGLPRVHHRTTDSTNERGRELATAGAPHGTLITADQQSSGRGRQGRSWQAPAGRALLMSLVLRDPPRMLPLAAAVAVARVAGEFAAGRALIKWPNDVLIGGRKVAGILVEGRPQDAWAVLGIGINVAVGEAEFPPELRDIAAGLGRAPSDIEPLLDGLLDELDRWLAADEAAVLEAWRERDALIGAPVGWAAGTGTAAGIDGDGRLVVRRDDGGRAALDAGEVHLIR